MTNTGEAASTWMDSAAEPTVSRISTLASWFTCSVRPVMVLVLKPAASPVIVYWPMGSSGIE